MGVPALPTTAQELKRSGSTCTALGRYRDFDSLKREVSAGPSLAQ